MSTLPAPLTDLTDEADDAPVGARLTRALVDSPFFEREILHLGLDPEMEQAVRRFRADGYLVIDDLLTADETDELVDEALPHFDFDADDGPAPRRIQDLWNRSDACKALALHPRVLHLLHTIYRRTPVPFQTLTFPVGTQQGAHSDTIHFNARPLGFMCGVWVALEDVTLDNGPLFYFPGSHRFPEIDFYDLWQTADEYDYPDYEQALEEMMAIAGIERHRLVIPKGTGLLWAANLIHGGSPIIRPGASRWSQVTHYFFEGCMYYTPMHSSTLTGEYRLRQPIDIGTGRRHRSTWNGVPISNTVDGSRVRIAMQF